MRRASPREWELLCLIRDGLEKSGQTPTNSELAVLLGIARPTVSQMLRRLQAKGYIAQLQGSRHGSIVLTAAGAANDNEEVSK